jgi:hypothetical protein
LREAAAYCVYSDKRSDMTDYDVFSGSTLGGIHTTFQPINNVARLGQQEPY